jgi:hypothetical protein
MKNKFLNIYSIKRASMAESGRVIYTQDSFFCLPLARVCVRPLKERIQHSNTQSRAEQYNISKTSSLYSIKSLINTLTNMLYTTAEYIIREAIINVAYRRETTVHNRVDAAQYYNGI